MDNEKIGRLISTLRRERHMTQLELAERMGISDKTVSKWERGLGCPEVALLPELSGIFEIDLEKLLLGELDEKAALEGNMKKTQLYRCPVCGNVIAAMTDTGISCCGKRLKPLRPKEAGEGERLRVERVEGDFYITADHPMERAHYISFVALLTGDSFIFKKQYPEWNLQARIPAYAHGRLLWCCTQHGLFYQEV